MCCGCVAVSDIYYLIQWRQNGGGVNHLATNKRRQQYDTTSQYLIMLTKPIGVRTHILIMLTIQLYIYFLSLLIFRKLNVKDEADTMRKKHFFQW